MATKPKTKTKAEAKPRKQEAADPEQYQRFREFAREIEADDDTASFDERFRKIVPPRSPSE